MTREIHPDTDFDQVMVTLEDAEEVVLVRVGERVHAYRNRCPHLGLRLDWGDGRCLHAGELVCAMHGARFTLEEGRCVDGPCRGDALQRIAVEVVDGAVRLA